MCYVAAAAAVMAAAAAYGTIESNKAANRQASAEMENANNAQIAEHNALAEQASQIADKGADERLARQREALRERARMRVESGGLAGNSVDVMFNKSLLNEEFDKGTIDKNVIAGLSQNLREGERVNTLAKNRYRSAKAQWVSGSKGASSMLISALSGGMQGYSMGQSLFKPEGGNLASASKAGGRSRASLARQGLLK